MKNVLGLALLAVAGCVQAVDSTPPKHPIAIYESVAEPQEGKPSRVLIEGNTLHFGGAGDTVQSLLASDIGHSLVFEEVEGGIRARTQPIVFPDGARTRFEFDDFSCAVTYQGRLAAVACTSQADGRVFNSRIDSGGLMEFEDRCFYTPERMCRYRLIDGKALRPSKIHSAS